MKKFNKLLIILLIAGLAGCEDNAIPVVTENVPANGTFGKFFFQVEEAPNLNFYFDDQKVSMAPSTVNDGEDGKPYGTAYPTNAYALIPSGEFTVTAKDTLGNVFASKSLSFAADKHYAVYLVGTEENPEIFQFEDVLPPIDVQNLFWRFINTMAGIPFALDGYAVRAAVPETNDSPEEPVEVITLGKNLSYMEVSEYHLLRAGDYTLKFFESGTAYDPETDEPYIQHSVNLVTKNRVYTTQIRGTYTDEPLGSNIDFWRER